MLSNFQCLLGFLTVNSSTFFLTSFFNVYLFLRERERETKHEWGRGRERGRQESEAGSRLRAVSTESHMGIELTNHETMT